jgi:hypothetical protein
VSSAANDHIGKASIAARECAPFQPISLEEVRRADHPAVVRAVTAILGNVATASEFSSFTSHSSSVAD